MGALFTQHQLHWLRHVIRRFQEHFLRKILHGQLHLGRRSAGRKMKRFNDQLKTSLKKKNIKPTDLEDAADRSIWRQLCHRGGRLRGAQRNSKNNSGDI
jgi:hypothetical protein